MAFTNHQYDEAIIRKDLQWLQDNGFNLSFEDIKCSQNGNMVTTSFKVLVHPSPTMITIRLPEGLTEEDAEDICKEVNEKGYKLSQDI